MKGLLIQNLPATERDDVFVSLRGENQEKGRKGESLWMILKDVWFTVSH